MIPTTPETIARDLPNGGAPLDGLVTAGQPDAAQLARLADAGFRSVVDLRAPREARGFDEAEAVRRAGLAYHNVPVVQGMVTDATFAAVRALLRDPDQRPMLLHCGSANRVGAALIPYLVLDEGLAPEAALRVARDVGLRSEPLAAAALAYVRAARSEG